MIATPIVSASRWRNPRKSETFTLIPFVDDPTSSVGATEIIGPTSKWVGPVIEPYYLEGSVKISRGAVRVSSYQGPLGEGSLTMTTILSVAKYQNPGLASAHSIHTVTFDIAGSYGTGRLTGFAQMEWKLDFSNTPRYYQIITMFLQGKDDLKGLKVFVESYGAFNPMPTFNSWWNVTIYSTG